MHCGVCTKPYRCGLCIQQSCGSAFLASVAGDEDVLACACRSQCSRQRRAVQMPRAMQRPTPSSVCFSPRTAPPPRRLHSQPPQAHRMWLHCQIPGRHPPLVLLLPAPQLQVQAMHTAGRVVQRVSSADCSAVPQSDLLQVILAGLHI